MVLREEHHNQSNTRPSSSSSSSSKKNKAKKIPQRGLGVAQLEKLRIEEQQKINGNNSSSPSSSVPSSTVISPPLQFLSSRDPNPSSAYLLHGNAEEINYLSNLWSDRLVRNNMNNKAALMPISMSSGVSSIQIEPPSNQNCSMNFSRRDEERIAGMNLSWPFHPETAVSIPYKVPQFSNPFLKPEEMLSSYGKSPLKFDYKSTFSKEGASRNSEVHINKRLKESSESSDIGILSLGSSARLKQSISILPEGDTNNATRQFTSSSERTFYSFLSMAPTAHEMDASQENNEAVDDVDTSLKL